MTYNGHPNWNYWNVALWLQNDPELYALCHHPYGDCRKPKDILEDLHSMGKTATPDGAKYTAANIGAALY